MASDETRCRILRRMSEDPDYAIRLGVARNKNIPSSCICEILDKLSRDGDEDVRSEVGRNINYSYKSSLDCACDLFKWLSDDPLWGVRSQVALNQDIPDECACEVFANLIRHEEDDLSQYMKTLIQSNNRKFTKCAPVEPLPRLTHPLKQKLIQTWESSPRFVLPPTPQSL